MQTEQCNHIQSLEDDSYGSSDASSPFAVGLCHSEHSGGSTEENHRSTINAVLGVHHGKAESVGIKAQPEIFTDKNNNKRSHDIMLLKLPSPTRIQPVPLPSCRKGPKISEKVQIAGHAATTGGPNNTRTPSKSLTLQCADIEVVSCKGLKKTLKKENPYFYQKMLYLHLFCGKSPRVDACDVSSHGFYLSPVDSL
ncbi:uncharacterized protein [Thunnus thynnus]|uniref:uncharacterized protein isoform X3 n=1 Tax=Thunnus thynnus TaxID=8237 RepID=UPI003527798D